MSTSYPAVYLYNETQPAKYTLVSLPLAPDATEQVLGFFDDVSEAVRIRDAVRHECRGEMAYVEVVSYDGETLVLNQ